MCLNSFLVKTDSFLSEKRYGLGVFKDLSLLKNDFTIGRYSVLSFFLHMALIRRSTYHDGSGFVIVRLV